MSMTTELRPTISTHRSQSPFTTSLVLGSGGARGYAHIGVIEELLAQGFDIRAIAGSSMGALVGGIFAAGKAQEYADWAKALQKLDVLRLMDWTMRGGGLIKGERIISVLKDLVGDINIEQLPMSYTAVAVDLDAQREVWFSQGSLFDAIRASIAIPTIFRPYYYQGRLLVDGGLLNPVPISATLRDMTDCTIAVDINAPSESLHAVGMSFSPSCNQERGRSGQASPEKLAVDADKTANRLGGVYREKLEEFIGSFFDKSTPRVMTREPGLVELFTRTLDTIQETLTRHKLAAQPPDLLITIPRNACAFYEFHRADELIELGRQRTREALLHWQRPLPRSM